MITSDPISTDFLNKCKAVFDFGENQLHQLIEKYPDYFPIYTVDGKWLHEGETWTNWCEGFLPGQLWLLFRHTGKPYWREKAEHYSKLIEPRKLDRTVHDMGFLFWSSWKRWYDLDTAPIINETIIQAGETLALRFKEKGQYLSSFIGPESLFIDIMMNVGIIFYAAREKNDQALYQKALQHCLTTRRCLVRGDGSTAHEGLFDLETGEFIRQTTHQGWRNDSSWARGLSWAIYGFGSAFSYTGDTRFLDTAEACARFYIERTPKNGVPPNDWEEPNPPTRYESSAAAIAASGLLNLSTLAADQIWGQNYRLYALHILDTLMTSEFLADATHGWEGILKHGIYHLNKGLGVDESVMWGDYFFMEAVGKVLGYE